MKSVTKMKTYLIFLVVFIMLCLCTCGASAAVKNGYLSKKLDEYYGTIRCLANILDDLMIPEYNSLLVCCGVWIMHDWLGGLVLDNCYDHNYYQLNNLTEPFLQQMEETCADYPKDSLPCRMMIITPITLLVIFFLLMLSLCGCAIFTFIRFRYYKRYYKYHKSQAFDSAGSEESTDEASTPTMKKRKSIDA